MTRAFFLLIVLIGGCLIGCAQNTETAQRQPTIQSVETPAINRQGQDTQGSDVKVWIINAPGSDHAALPDGGSEGVPSLVDEVLNQGNAVKKVAAGYAQSGITLNITTGGTAPNMSGTTTASGTGTQSPSMTSTQNPVQDIKPRVSAELPVSVAPGGVANAQATGSAGEGNVTSDMTNEVRQLRATLESQQSALQQLAALVQSLTQTVFGTTTTTSPAE